MGAATNHRPITMRTHGEAATVGVAAAAAEVPFRPRAATTIGTSNGTTGVDPFKAAPISTVN